MLTFLRITGEFLLRHWRALVLLAVIAALISAGYAWKAHNARQAAELARLQAANVALVANVAALKANERVVTEYVDRVKVVAGRTRTIIREVPVYVTPVAEAGCTITDGFVRVHDAAAQGVIPDPSRNPDAPAPGVALSTVAETVADNYGTAHEIAAQLKALQDWIRAQQAIH